MLARCHPLRYTCFRGGRRDGESGGVGGGCGDGDGAGDSNIDGDSDGDTNADSGNDTRHPLSTSQSSYRIDLTPVNLAYVNRTVT